jgi:hypothetical protein
VSKADDDEGSDAHELSSECPSNSLFQLQFPGLAVGDGKHGGTPGSQRLSQGLSVLLCGR